MNEKSQGQIILVTGAGSGIGRTTAIELARAGVRSKRGQSTNLDRFVING